MGLDFLRSMAKPFLKAISRDAASIARMASSCSTQERTLSVATLGSGYVSSLHIGDELTARKRGGVVELISGYALVGNIDDPRKLLLDQMDEGCGYAVATVIRLNPISETADVEIK